MRFADAWEEALAGATPWSDYVKRSEIEAREEAKQKAAGLLKNPDILDAVKTVCQRLGVAGESRLVQLTFLVATTRVLDQIVSLIVKGPSSVGKSFTVATVLR